MNIESRTPLQACKLCCTADDLCVSYQLFVSTLLDRMYEKAQTVHYRYYALTIHIPRIFSEVQASTTLPHPRPSHACHPCNQNTTSCRAAGLATGCGNWTWLNQTRQSANFYLRKHSKVLLFFLAIDDGGRRRRLQPEEGGKGSSSSSSSLSIHLPPHNFPPSTTNNHHQHHPSPRHVVRHLDTRITL